MSRMTDLFTGDTTGIMQALAEKIADRMVEVARWNGRREPACELTVTPEVAIVKIRGKDALFERGMGPSGLGSFGPYDMRRELPRFRRRKISRGGGLYASVPTPQGPRTMAQDGKPWTHPGVRPTDARRVVLDELLVMFGEVVGGR